jgi:hypothetical protein
MTDDRRQMNVSKHIKANKIMWERLLAAISALPDSGLSRLEAVSTILHSK